MLDRLRGRLASWLPGREPAGRDGEVLSYQLQVFSQGEAPPTPAERARSTPFSAEARDRVGRLAEKSGGKARDRRDDDDHGRDPATRSRSRAPRLSFGLFLAGLPALLAASAFAAALTTGLRQPAGRVLPAGSRSSGPRPERPRRRPASATSGCSR